MTRFEMEISGMLGDYWKRDAEKKVKDYMSDALKSATVDKDGAISWISNGRYLMDDYCEVLEYGGFKFSREETGRKRSVQSAQFIENYRRNYKVPSAEELSEMRAAFGEGTTVVDVFTGRKVRL